MLMLRESSQGGEQDRAHKVARRRSCGAELGDGRQPRVPAAQRRGRRRTDGRDRWPNSGRPSLRRPRGGTGHLARSEGSARADRLDLGEQLVVSRKVAPLVELAVNCADEVSINSGGPAFGPQSERGCCAFPQTQQLVAGRVAQDHSSELYVIGGQLAVDSVTVRPTGRR